MVNPIKSKKKVISASRRTDIPAFYMDWFMESINRGRFDVVNPYTKKISQVPVSPDTVHTIVFWSKNFARFIEGGYGKALNKLGYNLFFNFTINTPHKILEPNIPHIAKRLEQMHYLCGNFGAKSINWRFDPICHYTYNSQELMHNLDAFDYIAEKLGSWGVERCISSFMDDYSKISKRLGSIKGFSFVTPGLNKKIEIVKKMGHKLEGLGIKLMLCCEKQLMDALPEGSPISVSSCVPNDILEEVFGGKLSRAKDAGQRKEKGCGCKVSTDIGSYGLHPCGHNCLFCYANPVDPKKLKTIKQDCSI